jgi:transcriptional regulator with XRE-family HTH domain
MPGQRGGELEGRNGRVYQLYAVQRWTQEAIAAELGVTQQRVSAILKAVREALPPIDLGEYRQQAIELHLDVIKRAYEMAGMKGAPVTAGKDGDVVYDPEGGAVVRDYALRGSALNLVIKAEAELRKLLGADAATKIETSGSVRVELVGIAVEDLT